MKKTQLMLQWIDNGVLVTAPGKVIGKRPDGTPIQDEASAFYCGSHEDLANHLKKYWQPEAVK